MEITLYRNNNAAQLCRMLTPFSGVQASQDVYQDFLNNLEANDLAQTKSAAIALWTEANKNAAVKTRAPWVYGMDDEIRVHLYANNNSVELRFSSLSNKVKVDFNW